MHSYLPRQVFAPLNDCSVVFSDITNGVKATQIQESSSKAVKNTVEKVHKHICGHAPYSNIKLLLIRNNFWNDSAERYLNDAVEQCTGYRRTSLPKSKRKVSISSKSRPINKVVRVNHFFFQELWLLHAMDSVTRCAACCIFPDTKLPTAVLAFESCWIGKFWPPTTVLGYQFWPHTTVHIAFGYDQFRQFLATLDIVFQKIPLGGATRMSLNPNMV